MKSSLDVIFMRRPKFNYQSPAVCEANFSTSATPVIVLEPLAKLVPPTGLVLGGGGNPFRLTWGNYPGVLCYSIYKAVDELDPFGEYTLIAECVDDNFIDLDDFGNGVYRITAITPEGESAFSDPFTVNVVVPPSEASITLIDIEVVTDFSEDATVIVGYRGNDAAVYKDGVVTTHRHGDFSYFAAVSPNGHWMVGGDTISGIDNKVSYDFSTYRNLGNDGFLGTVLIDVNNSGHAFSSSKRIVDAQTGGTILDIPLWLPGAGLVSDFNHPHVINGSDQIPLTDVTNNRIIRFSGFSALNVNPPDWGSNQGAGATVIINNAGHVVATYENNVAQNRTFIYNGSFSASIGDFGGFVTAFAMSETDWVVGRADNGSGFYGAFKWHPDHALEMVPLIPDMTPGSEGFALDVNDAGWIVGSMDNKAFLHKANELVSVKLIDLLPPDTGWTSLEIAYFINNLNQVVGVGTKDGVPNQVFLLQLV